MEIDNKENIIEVLEDKVEFNKFLRLIMKTSFEEILQGKGPFTILAPKDSAFDNLPGGTYEDLVSDGNKVGDIISQHVIIGRLLQRDIEEMDELPTMANQTLAVEQHNEGLIVGGAKIVESDIVCTNGVIHIIDIVLAP